MGADGLTEGYLRFVFGLVAVIAMIVVAVWIAKRLGIGTAQGFRGKGRRLSLLEVMPLDAKRKLVLIRQDTTEHLLLLGANHEMLLASSEAPVPPSPVDPHLGDRPPLAPFLSVGRES